MSRIECPDCHYPISHCLCSAVTKVEHRTRLLILQHPQEAKNKKNTTRLLSLCSNNISIVQGETFSPSEIIEEKSTALLFPNDDAETTNNNDVNTRCFTKQSIQQIVAIDATWRKAKRMLHLNPWLTSLPTISLSNDLPQKYGIRSTKIENGLSTLEACAYVIEQQDGVPADTWLNVLEAFKKQFVKDMPTEVKQRYSL